MKFTLNDCEGFAREYPQRILPGTGVYDVEN